MLKKTKEKRYPFFEKIQDAYAAVLAFCLKIKIIPLAISIVLLVICIYQVMRMGITMMPEMTGEQISITVQVPEETEKEDAFAMADQVMEAALSVDGVETVGAMDGSSSSSMIGAGAGGSDFLNYQFSILLEEGIKDIYEIRAISDKISEATSDIGCEVSVSASAMGDMTAMMGSGLSLNIYGDSTEKLLDISEDVQELVAEIKGFENISNGQEDGAKELHLMINKDKAMKILRSRLYEALLEEQNDKIASERKSQVGTGNRSERIRTYNFPESRVTDHRIGLTLYRLEYILNGNLDEVIDALATADQAAKLASQFTQEDA